MTLVSIWTPANNMTLPIFVCVCDWIKLHCICVPHSFIHSFIFIFSGYPGRFHTFVMFIMAVQVLTTVYLLLGLCPSVLQLDHMKDQTSNYLEGLKSVWQVGSLSGLHFISCSLFILYRTGRLGDNAQKSLRDMKSEEEQGSKKYRTLST